MKTVRILMVAALLGACALMPGAWGQFFDYFDPITRDVNVGHFDLHPASLMMSGMFLVLPVVLLLSILGYRACTRLAMLLVLYFPIYVIFGNYVVEPRGLHTQPMNLLILIVFVFGVEVLFMKHLKARRLDSPFGKSI